MRPNWLGKIMISGTQSINSLKRDKAIECIGFPNACKKMLDAFTTLQRITLERKIRKHNTANSLYKPSSLPKILIIRIGNNSKASMETAPTHSTAAIIFLKISRTRGKKQSHHESQNTSKVRQFVMPVHRFPEKRTA